MNGQTHQESGNTSSAKGTKRFDLIVIGGGSAGFAAAIQAHELGKKVLMVNAGTIGGTCVNVGCVPSKTLIRAAESLHRGRHHPFAGIDGQATLVDFESVIRQKDELVAQLRQAKYVDVLKAYDRVELIEGRARMESLRSVRVGERVYESASILVVTGSRPWLPDIPGLAESAPLDSTLAFELTRLPESLIVVDEHLQTSQPGIFAAGDVIGEPAFVYTAAYEGHLAAANALSQERKKRDYRALPWVIFSDPQVAGVGLNEQEAARAGIEVDVATLELKNVPRALAARDTRGFIKLLRRKGSDELIGARILAPEGGEQIMEAALAIRHGIGVSELASAFHPYLTQAEGIKLCAQTFGKDVAKLSCCSA